MHIVILLFIVVPETDNSVYYNAYYVIYCSVMDCARCVAH